MSSPGDRKYLSSHEWVQMEGGNAVLGITQFAVDALTDLVFLDLPPKGKKVEAGKPFGSIESVKAVSDLISPVSGEVVEVNTPLAQKPESLASDPWKAGWMIKVKTSATPQGLMDAAAYDRTAAAGH